MTRWTWIGFAVLGAVVIASVLVPTGLSDDIRPGATVVAPTALPRAEADYYEALAPRLERAALGAGALVAIGERRSRNLLEIRAAQDRMDESLDALDLLLANRPPPTRFARSVETYRDGSAAVREAMSEARAAFLRFDWDRVAAAYEVAGEGAATLRRATSELGTAAGRPESATPDSPTKLDRVTHPGPADDPLGTAADVL